MPSETYFHEHALRQRFTLDVRQAQGLAHINESEQQRLLELLDEPSSTAPLRVDQLVMDDGSPTCAELASAWMISDPALHAGPVWLHSLLHGLERFDNRQRLMAVLEQRFGAVLDPTRALDAERVGAPLFEQRMLTILEQQVGHLQALTAQLQGMPKLHQVVGQVLQQQLRSRLPDSSLDVFSHLLQIIRTDEPASGAQTPDRTVMSMTLADAALHDFIDKPLPTGMARQFLDERGALLTPAQATPYVEACAAVARSVSGLYEYQLADFWASTTEEGRNARDMAARTLSESYRHALLAAREARTLTLHEFRILRNLLPLPTPDTVSQPVIVSRISLSASLSGTFKLAGIFLIEFPFGQLPGIYLYSSQSGISRLTNRQALIAHFSTAAGRRHLDIHTSLEDRALVGEGALDLRLDEIEQSLFLGHIDSVIAVQKRNLRYALDLDTVPLASEQVAARIEDALDIRGLLEWRSLHLSDSGRWLAGDSGFVDNWPNMPALPTLASTVQLALLRESGHSWVRSIQTLDRFVDELGAARPDLHDCAARLLDGYLAVLGEPALRSRTLWVQSGEGAFVGLVELFLRRASGYSSDRILSGYRVYDGSPEPHWAALGQRLPVSLLNHMFDHALTGFAQAYEDQVRGFHSRSLRLPDRLIRPRALASRIREEALRLALSIEYRTSRLQQTAIDMIWQVMDRPLDRLREVWGDGAVTVSRVQFSYARASVVVALTNTFVLERPKQPGSYVFWSTFTGFQAYASLAQLQEFIRAELGSCGHRQQWLDLLEPAASALLATYLGQSGSSAVNLRLQVIEGHFIEALQSAEIERHSLSVMATYQRVVRLGVNADLFSKLLRATESIDRNRNALNCVAISLQGILRDTLMPAWLKTARPTELTEFVLAARQLYITFDPQRTFLFGIPELREYARQALATRLKADFPGRGVDPDDITVTLTLYTPALVPTGDLPSPVAAATRRVSESLPDFAINRLGGAQQGILSIAVDNDDEQLLAALTSDYVDGLVRALDVGGNYQRLLDEKLGEQTADYARREAFYLEQHPPLERLTALEARIKGELSQQAYQYVEAVLYMPDGLARTPLDGREIIFSPLQLLAAAGAVADPVTGMYVIAPREPLPGPWLLYALLDDSFVFKEYADKAALEAAIRSSASLQKIIFQRLSARAQVTYGHGGFSEPHLHFSTESSFDLPFAAPSEVTLQVTPCQGNALQVLFAGTLEILKLLVKVWSVTSRDSDRQSTLNLLSLVVAQGMVFLPGRLGVLVGLWQSESLLQASVDAATRQDWGEVAATFSTALSTLVGGHPVLEEEPVELLEADEDPQPEDFSSLPEFGWSRGTLSPQQVGLLRQLAASDVTLQSLEKDPLLNLYRSKRGSQQYAAVAGVVYRVRQGDQGWRIVGDLADGPPIRLNDQQQWELDLPWGLKGGGGIVTRMQNTAVEMQLRSLAVVEAEGMQVIRRKYSDRARRIAEAHSYARHYLENCLDNLNYNGPEGGIDMRTRNIVSDFFGVPQPDERLYAAIRASAQAILDALMDPSLSPFNSPRFVVVSNRIGNENATAFILDRDSRKRIFLSELFFRVPHYRLKMQPVWQQPFNHGAHFRGSTLIHELSHLVGDTEDIAYVESNAPFFDLLTDSTPYYANIKQKLHDTQELTLSHLTDEGELFKQLKEGIWSDLKRADGNAKQSVLTLTVTTTLAQARRIFYDNPVIRSEVILKNADSVTLLITLLGRQRFAD